MRNSFFLLFFFCLHFVLFYSKAENEPVEDLKISTISTNNCVIIYNKEFQGKIQSMEYKKNKITCKGECVFWYKNIQISGENITIILNKDKETIEKVIIEEDIYTKAPALLVIFNDLGLPNHFTAKKITFIFSVDDMSIEKILLEENVKTFYIILKDDKIEWINKSTYKKLEPFFNKNKNKWDVNMEISKGELVSATYAAENWNNIVLSGFKLYDNDIRENKDFL